MSEEFENFMADNKLKGNYKFYIVIDYKYFDFQPDIRMCSSNHFNVTLLYYIISIYFVSVLLVRCVN